MSESKCVPGEQEIHLKGTLEISKFQHQMSSLVPGSHRVVKATSSYANLSHIVKSPTHKSQVFRFKEELKRPIMVLESSDHVAHLLLYIRQVAIGNPQVETSIGTRLSCKA